jgi:3-mercaptopyruvate sulfurtransferase SseA
MTAPFEGPVQYAAEARPRHTAAVRYQFVDCRWDLSDRSRGRELYLEAHIPGASFLDVDDDLAAPPDIRGRHPLPDPGDFAAAASRAGIGAGVFVVAYGSMGGAERLWWLLRHFGHDDCAVIGFEAWLGPLTAGEEEIEPASFEPRPRSDDTVPELPAGELVAYCGSGVTSSVTVHRLALAGRDAKLCPGSWSEWEQRPDLPVERG